MNYSLVCCTRLLSQKQTLQTPSTCVFKQSIRRIDVSVPNLAPALQKAPAPRGSSSSPADLPPPVATQAPASVLPSPPRRLPGSSGAAAPAFVPRRRGRPARPGLSPPRRSRGQRRRPRRAGQSPPPLRRSPAAHASRSPGAGKEAPPAPAPARRAAAERSPAERSGAPRDRAPAPPSPSPLGLPPRRRQVSAGERAGGAVPRGPAEAEAQARVRARRGRGRRKAGRGSHGGADRARRAGRPAAVAPRTPLPGGPLGWVSPQSPSVGAPRVGVRWFPLTELRRAPLAGGCPLTPSVDVPRWVSPHIAPHQVPLGVPPHTLHGCPLRWVTPHTPSMGVPRWVPPQNPHPWVQPQSQRRVTKPPAPFLETVEIG